MENSCYDIFRRGPSSKYDSGTLGVSPTGHLSYSTTSNSPQNTSPSHRGPNVADWLVNNASLFSPPPPSLPLGEKSGCVSPKGRTV